MFGYSTKMLSLNVYFWVCAPTIAVLLEVNNYNVWTHKYYWATCKFQCGQWGLKIIFEKQIRFGCSVNIVPVCFSGWVTWTQIDKQTDRQTKGRMRVIVMLCQNDSVGLLSFSPQPLTEGLRHLDEFRLTTRLDVTYSNFIFTHHVLKCLFWFLLSSACLSLFTSSCLAVCWSICLSAWWVWPPKPSPPSAGDSSLFSALVNMLLCLINGDSRLLRAGVWCGYILM